VLGAAISPGSRLGRPARLTRGRLAWFRLAR
jgi:hypothetical protein